MNGRILALAGVALLCAVGAMSAPPEASGEIKAGKIYWTDPSAGKIRRANLDGSDPEDLVSGIPAPSDIALDTVNGRMYWSEPSVGRIRRANLEIPSGETHSTRTDVATCYDGLRKVTGIALDVAGEKIYWIQYPATDNESKILWANLDCSGGEQVLRDLVSDTAVYRIALDLDRGYAYWNDAANPFNKIQRCNLKAGCTVQDVATGLDDPAGVALDVAGNKLYWADSGAPVAKIQRCNLKPNCTVEDVATALSPAPFGIALDVTNQTVYWTGGGDIERCVWKPVCTPETIFSGGAEDIELDIPGPVGGIAELPQVAGTPVQTTGSWGPSAGVLAGIAAAVAASALASAAWYARRRWHSSP